MLTYLFNETGSSYIAPCWPGTHSVGQTGFAFRELRLCLCAGLKRIYHQCPVYTAMGMEPELEPSVIPAPFPAPSHAFCLDGFCSYCYLLISLLLFSQALAVESRLVLNSRAASCPGLPSARGYQSAPPLPAASYSCVWFGFVYYRLLFIYLHDELVESG